MKEIKPQPGFCGPVGGLCVLHFDGGGCSSGSLQVLRCAGVNALVHLSDLVHQQHRLRPLPILSVQLHYLHTVLRVQRTPNLNTGYSQVNSTSTSCSPITVQDTWRFCPTATDSEDAWSAGDGGAAGSERV